MKFFLHTATQVRIIDEAQEFSCAPEEFQELEPEYPALPAGKILRYWTPDFSYSSDGDLLFPDSSDCLPYVNKCSSYAGLQNVIWAHVNLSKTTLCVNSEPADHITFSAALKYTQDPESVTLPVSEEWIIRLRHESGIVYDSFLTAFAAGECEYCYVHKDNLPLGVWHLDEKDFITIILGVTRYHIRLANPVEFTIYREL